MEPFDVLQRTSQGSDRLTLTAFILASVIIIYHIINIPSRPLGNWHIVRRNTFPTFRVFSTETSIYEGNKRHFQGKY